MEKHFEAQQQFQRMQLENASVDNIAYISCKPKGDEGETKLHRYLNLFKGIGNFSLCNIYGPNEVMR